MIDAFRMRQAVVSIVKTGSVQTRGASPRGVLLSHPTLLAEINKVEYRSANVRRAENELPSSLLIGSMPGMYPQSANNMGSLRR